MQSSALPAQTEKELLQRLNKLPEEFVQTKRIKIVRNKGRLQKDDVLHKAIATCAGVHNFSLSTKPFQYMI